MSSPGAKILHWILELAWNFWKKFYLCAVHMGCVSFWKHPKLLRVCSLSDRSRKQLFPLPSHSKSRKVNYCTPVSRIVIMNQGLWWSYPKMRTSRFQTQHLTAAWTQSNSSNWRRQHQQSPHPGRSLQAHWHRCINTQVQDCPSHFLLPASLSARVKSSEWEPWDSQASCRFWTAL